MKKKYYRGEFHTHENNVKKNCRGESHTHSLKKNEKKYLRGESDTHAKKKLGGLFVQGVMKKLENIAKFKKNSKNEKN